MKANHGLRAGAGEADITPAMGIQIGGDIGRYRPVEEVRDPLFAKALVLESGSRRMCWLVLDVLIMHRRWADEIRRQVAAQYGIPYAHIMVHATQTHSAPAVGNCFVQDGDVLGVFPKAYPWLLGGDDRYNPQCVAGALAAVGKAVANLRAAQVSVGRGVDGRNAFNRRFILRDGTVKTHPPACSPDILCCEGPIDPEVGVMQFTGRDGKPIAVVLHHTCHPTHGYPHRWISADWPGAWSAGVREMVGSGATVLVLNGFCGNIHHWNHLDPNWKHDCAGMSRRLTETVAGVLTRLAPIERPVLDVATRELRIKMRAPTAKEVRESRALLKRHPQPTWKNKAQMAVAWDWVYAAMRLDLAQHVKRHPYENYPIQVFRLGNTAIVAAAGEPFVEEQLRIKEHSPAAFTFMAHYANGYTGYIPTEQAFARGGYETHTSSGSKLAPTALTRIGDGILELARGLFD